MHRARHSVVLRTHASHRMGHCVRLTEPPKAKHPLSTAWALLIATNLNVTTCRRPQSNLFDHVQLPIHTYIFITWYTKAVGMIGIL